MKNTRRAANSCKECSQPVGMKHEAVECDYCMTWIHCACDKELSSQVYKFLCDLPSPAIKYFCPSCRNNFLRIVGSKKTPDQQCTTDPTTQKPDISPPSSIKQNPTAPSCSTIQASSCSGKLADPVPPVIPPTLQVTTNYVDNVDAVNDEFIQTKQAKRNQHTNTPNSTQCPTLLRNNIIVYNLPENSHISLTDREEADRQQWHKLCDSLHVKSSQPISITRLRTLHHNNQSCRPARVSLSSVEEAENTLLMAGMLRQTGCNIRIKPDFPWAIREARRMAFRDPNTKSYDQQCSIIVHGVPESTDDSPTEKHIFDTLQWKYIVRKMCPPDEECSAWSLGRLPRPTHLTTTSPRLMRVTFLTPTMKDSVLEHWYNKRMNFSSEIRLHPDRPRTDRHRAAHPLPVPMHSTESPKSAPATTDTQEKNLSRPTLEKSA